MIKKKSIALLFASLLLVILGHDIIPHHHHATHHHACQEGHHHKTGTDAFHELDLSECCHAFNDLEYYPATVKIDIKKSFRSTSGQYLSMIIQPGLALPLRKISFDTGGSPQALARLDASASGLRGPPCFS
jgi:hypothetical protein